MEKTLEGSGLRQDLEQPDAQINLLLRRSEDDHFQKSEEVQIEAAARQLNTVDVELLSRESIHFKSRAALRIIVVVVIQGISLSAFGIDYGVVSGVVALPDFRTKFGIPDSASGSKWGLIVASIYIGNFVASAFVWLSDVIGRRGVTLLGSIITVIGAVIQATAPNYIGLIVGRLLTGGGGALTATVAPLYMTELAPACWRGLVVGLSASWANIGGIIINIVVFGCAYIKSDWSWRLPLVVQVVAPFIVCILVYPLTPESPRYLMYRGKEEAARQVLAKYHTSSEDPNCQLVDLEITQIKESLALMDSKPLDFTPLYKRKPDRYRLFLIFLYSMFQQWNGTSLFGYYLPAILSLVGITDSHQQLGFNLGQPLAGWLATLIGAPLFDRFKRRFLLMLAMAMFVVFLVLITICSALFEHNSKPALGYLIMVWIYLFVICNGLLVVPMHSIYPNEVLHYTQRAKGMGMYSLFQACFGITLTYGVSAAMSKIGWKIYLVFIVIDLGSLGLTWSFFPEFKSLSLEEIDLIFETPGTNPVKLSKQLQQAKRAKRRHDADAAGRSELVLLHRNTPEACFRSANRIHAVASP